MIGRDEWPQCPVCRARFRDSCTCSRCGADLRPLMFLITKAYYLRQDARLAIERADFERVWERASEAEALCSTRKGADLRLLSSWLLSTPSPAIIDPVP